jgi:hypothetical protein
MCCDDMEGCRFEVVDDSGGCQYVDDMRAWSLSGYVYPDGSCMPHVLSELSRAAWAAVKVDGRGSVRRAVFGVVPSYIRQTAYAAEWCGAAVVAQLADGACDVAQDCKGVVNEWQNPPPRQLRADSVYAGQARELRKYPSRAHVSMRWIRGHMLDKVNNPQNIADLDERRDALGNAAADRYANVARDMHPQPEQWLADRVRRDIDDVTAVLKHAAKVMVLWPKVDRDELRAAHRVAARGPTRADTRTHCWIRVGEIWQCAACMATALSDESVARRRRESCRGVAKRLRQVLADPRGHRLAVGDVDGGPCVLCVVCGAWCRLRPKLLLEECRGMAGREAAGLTALKRFKQGYLPSDGTDGGAPTRRVDGVRPLSAKAVAHWECWREPARHDLASWREAAKVRASSCPTLTLREKVAFLCRD